MGLASMLAGERFSDHPKSVCGVIAAFLRPYNDAIDSERREDLYACAAAVVGSRSSRATERARTERMLATLDELGVQLHGRECLRWLPSRAPGREVIGLRLARALATEDRGHRRALALVDEIIAIDVAEAPQPEAATDRSPGEAAGAGTQI
jgi:hypothetical protein